MEAIDIIKSDLHIDTVRKRCTKPYCANTDWKSMTDHVERHGKENRAHDPDAGGRDISLGMLWDGEGRKEVDIESGKKVRWFVNEIRVWNVRVRGRRRVTRNWKWFNGWVTNKGSKHYQIRCHFLTE